MSDHSPITEILDELRAGRMIVLVDDAKRENEGDLTLAAEKATPQAINFMLKEARGWLPDLDAGEGRSAQPAVSDL